jgi:hypothetical protein
MTKIAIAIIFFVLGVISLVVYRNNFSLTSKIEKCANTSRAWQNHFIKQSLKDKLDQENYAYDFRACEREAKQYPELFKTKY